MRTTLHDRYRCAQNVDHFAHNTLFSLFFAEVVCTVGTTQPQTVISPPPNGGIALHEAPTRRRHASRGLHVVQTPHLHRHGGHRRDRRAWPRAGEIGRPGCGARRTRCPWPAGPGRTTSRSADRSSRRGRLAARTAEAGGTDTTASQISHAIPPQHESTQAQKP